MVTDAEVGGRGPRAQSSHSHPEAERGGRDLPLEPPEAVCSPLLRGQEAGTGGEGFTCLKVIAALKPGRLISRLTLSKQLLGTQWPLY